MILGHLKKSLIVAAVIAALVLAGMAALGQKPNATPTTRSEWTKFNPVTQLTAASFAKPPAADWPWVRMNIPATADPAEIKAELQDMRDKGIAGVEIGQGAFPNNEQLVALLTAGNEFGIKISISHGPTQNPTGYSIDNDHARKTLVVGRTLVDAGATFEGPLPPPTLTVVGRSGFGGAGGRGAAGGRGPAGGRAPAGGTPAAAGAGGRIGAGGRGGA
jgi:hypothetical protein